MSSNCKKSAKDLAFDKERAKYNKQIRELKLQLKEKDDVIKLQKECIEANSTELCELRDWVQRLLDYTELSEEDMKRIINKEKKSAEVIEQMSNVSKVFSMLSGVYS